MNNDIIEAFNTILAGAALGYPIAWPNVKFTPPNSGVYLRVTHAANRGIDDTLAGQNVIRQGLFQVTIVDHQNEGIIELNTVAGEVAALFPKLTPLADVRVSRVPYVNSVADVGGGYVQLALTIEYSG